jgi:ankyrin repeat protein
MATSKRKPSRRGTGTLYQVGSTRRFTNLQAVAPFLKPGDVVEVDGNVTYSGGVSFNVSGTPDQPITIRGLRVKGRRPVIFGTVSFGPVAIVQFLGSHYVFEGFEVTADHRSSGKRGIRNVGDNLTIRDCVVHNCGDGIAGSDLAGSLTLQFVEVYNCGHYPASHQVYVAAHNTLYPNAVFRMEHCYLHDGHFGSNVKTRYGRNEIYHNWIEGAAGHELDLLGADAFHQDPGMESAVREDSDVVGNVLIKHAHSYGSIAHIGSDGTGVSDGRYRFVNNTIIIDPNHAAYRPVFWMQDAVESVEMHNNVIYRGGTPAFVLSDVKLFEGATYHICASNNWVPNGSRSVPKAWTNTICGDDPGFSNAAAFNFLLSSSSPLRNAGAASTSSPAGYPFPAPLKRPLFHPPPRHLGAHYKPVPRPKNGALDIGAFGWADGQKLVAAPRIPVVKHHGFPPIHQRQFEFDVAAEEGDMDRVKALLKSDPQLLHPKTEGKHALNLAATDGQLEMVKFLLDQGADIHSKDPAESTPLHCAAFRGHTEVIRVLLARGAKVDLRDHAGMMPLRIAAQWNRHTKVVQLLIDHKADVNAADYEGWTSLHAAVAFGRLGVAELLLTHKANINAVNSDGLTPLYYAVLHKRKEMAQLLASHGAALDVLDPDGDTPLQLAVRIEEKEIAGVLRKHGAQ